MVWLWTSSACRVNLFISAQLTNLTATRSNEVFINRWNSLHNILAALQLSDLNIDLIINEKWYFKCMLNVIKQLLKYVLRKHKKSLLLYDARILKSLIFCFSVFFFFFIWISLLMTRKIIWLAYFACYCKWKAQEKIKL